MWLAARAVPGLAVDHPGRIVLAALAATAGFAAAIAGVVQFRRAKTTVNPLRPETASSLVTGGVYRVSRNPMYLGMALILFGWAVWLGNPATVLVLPLFVAYMTRFQIIPEERALTATFGEVFAEYRRRVRRWL